MVVHLRHRSDITLDAFRRVAWLGESARIDPETLVDIDGYRQEFLDLLAADPTVKVYGVNVHAGDGSSRHLSDDDKQQYLKGLGSGVSFGSPLPERVTRGIVLARLASFLDGNAAVRSILAQHIAAMTERTSLPKVPAHGNGGSGEIQALGHLFGCIPDELSLAPKESMSLINGSPCASSLVADTYLRAIGATSLVEEVLALAADALGAPHTHFSAGLELAWDDADEHAALRRMRELLAEPQTPRRDSQALVSIRIIPRVLASVYRAREAAGRVAATSLRSVSDNPIFVPATDEFGTATVMSNGSFHNQHAVVAIDALTRSWADLCQLLQALVQGLYADRVALPGLDNTGLGVLYMPGSAWAEEARVAATPAIIPAPALGQNDVPSPVFHSWNRSVRVEECLYALMALVSALASQSYASTGAQPTAGLSGIVKIVREELPPVTGRHNIGNELGRLAQRFAAVSTDLSSAPQLN